MRVSPQDDVRTLAAHAAINKSSREHVQQALKDEQRLSLEEQVKKARIEQGKFTREQFQKLLDGIYFEKGRQSARVLKGTNVDVYV